MPATNNDVTNRWLAKFTSLEFLMTILAGVVSLTLAYAALSSDIAENRKTNEEQSEKIDQISKNQEETKEDISEINTKVAVIQTDLKNIDKDLEEIKELIRERRN